MIELFNKQIKAIYTNEEKDILIFITILEGNIAYEAIGDCCSQTWFESITNIENIIYNTITGIERKEFSDGHDDKITKELDQECIRCYGYTFKTESGYTDIEYRNSSNGFYGGDCEKLEIAILSTFPDKKVDFNDLPVFTQNEWLSESKPLYLHGIGVKLLPWPKAK